MWKDIFEAKYKLFKRGFFSGGATGFIFLFWGKFPESGLGIAILLFVLKLIAAFAIAFISGIGTVAAGDFWQWFKTTNYGKRIMKIFKKENQN